MEAMAAATERLPPIKSSLGSHGTIPPDPLGVATAKGMAAGAADAVAEPIVLQVASGASIDKDSKSDSARRPGDQIDAQAAEPASNTARPGSRASSRLDAALSFAQAEPATEMAPTSLVATMAVAKAGKKLRWVATWTPSVFPLVTDLTRCLSTYQEKEERKGGQTWGQGSPRPPSCPLTPPVGLYAGARSARGYRTADPNSRACGRVQCRIGWNAAWEYGRRAVWGRPDEAGGTDQRQGAANHRGRHEGQAGQGIRSLATTLLSKALVLCQARRMAELNWSTTVGPGIGGESCPEEVHWCGPL